MAQMTFEEFRVRYAENLTEQQLKAVTAPEGPTLLLAVPGSGKTTVLVTRLGYLILCCGVEARRILTITYTVAATKDMKNRFAAIFGEELAAQLEFRTINGICAKIISYYAHQVNRSPLQLVEDEKRTNGILTAIYLKTEHSYPTEGDLKAVRMKISYIKNMLLTGEEIRKLDEKADFKISEIYRLYAEEMKSRGLMDYDDQMRYALGILRRDSAVLSFFQRQYTCICVDEAQDTSRIQHVIAAHLAAGHRNLFMVGDEDQSIYGFRAAYPQALLEFEKNYSGANVMLMETNFRSDEAIVREADRFIAKNKLRHEKHMKAGRMPSSNAEGQSVQKILLRTRKDQYSWLLNEAVKRRKALEQGLSVPEAAVLYRENESALPLLDLLDREGLPFSMRSGDWTFFTNRVVLDIRSFLAFASNPLDTEAFLQIYYKMDLYLSREAAEDAVKLCRERRGPLMEYLIASSEEPDYKKKRFREAWGQLKRIPKVRPTEAIETIMSDLGYAEYLQKKQMGDQKVTTLRFLAGREQTVTGFLDRLDRLQDIVREKRPGMPGELVLSTIHSSKGLEYDRVYLLDVIDGIFPEEIPASWGKKGKEAEEENILYEEERRLFYVAITRAKNELILFSTFQKSSFCDEIFAADKKASRSLPAAPQPRVPKKQKEEKPKLSFTEFCEQFGDGVCVQHRSIGEGVVTQMDDRRITILFAEDALPHTFLLRILYEKNLLTLPEQE